MYTAPPKKMLIINILDIMKRYTDENHRLSQKEIMDILESEYSMKVERKAVKRNLMNLLDFGYEIEYSESIRINKSGQEEVKYSDWYLVRDFTDAELRLLIDSLLFSKHIPYSQCKALIEKLSSLSNIYFNSKVKHVRGLPESTLINKQLFFNIDILDEAIGKNRQVKFTYNKYGTDKKLHPVKSASGEAREYIVNPYQIVATNGRYYLIGNYDKYDNVSHYRIDRITNIECLQTPAKDKSKVDGMKHGLDLPKHMAEHIYMFSGDSTTVTFLADTKIVDQIIDWFGKDVIFSDETEDTVTAKVTANEDALYRWIFQYGEFLKVLSPASMVKKIASAVSKVAEKYS